MSYRRRRHTALTSRPYDTKTCRTLYISAPEGRASPQIRDILYKYFDLVDIDNSSIFACAILELNGNRRSGVKLEDLEKPFSSLVSKGSLTSKAQRD